MVESSELDKNDAIKNFTNPVSTTNVHEEYIIDLKSRVTFLENHFILLVQHIKTLYSSIKYLGFDNLTETECPKHDINGNIEEFSGVNFATCKMMAAASSKNDTAEKFQGVDFDTKSTYKMTTAEIANSEHNRNNTVEKFQSVDFCAQITCKMITAELASSERCENNMGELSKTDISAQFTRKLLKEATDINLKIRINALNKILKIVDANKKIGPNLGGLPRILKLRLSDNNIDLQIISLDICSKIATAMGSPFKKYATTFINSVTEVLKTQKNAIVREHAIGCLKCFASAIGISSVEKLLATRYALLQKDLQVLLSNTHKDVDDKNNLSKLQEYKEDVGSNIKSADHDFKLKKHGDHKGAVKQRNDAICLVYDTESPSKKSDIKEFGQKSISKGNKNHKLTMLPKPTGSLAIHPNKKENTNMEYSMPNNNKNLTIANSSGIPPAKQSTSECDSLSLVKVDISKIMNSDYLQCIKLLKQLNKQLKISSGFANSYVFELVNVLTDKIRTSYTQLDLQSQPNIQLYKSLINTLDLLFSNKKLALVVSQDLLEGLLIELTYQLSNSNLQNQETGQHLSKALRISINKVLLNSNRNLIYGALLSILKTSFTKLQEVDDLTVIIKFTEFIMKYLQHLSKYVKNNIKSHILRPNELLRDLNEFLLSAPPEWENQVKEKMPLGEEPFNIIQIILKKLVEELGENIYNHLDLISDFQRSHSLSIEYFGSQGELLYLPTRFNSVPQALNTKLVIYFNRPRQEKNPSSLTSSVYSEKLNQLSDFTNVVKLVGKNSLINYRQKNYPLANKFDYIFVDNDYTNFCQKVVTHFKFSKPLVVCTLETVIWKLNKTLLNDPEVEESINNKISSVNSVLEWDYLKKNLQSVFCAFKHKTFKQNNKSTDFNLTWSDVSNDLSHLEDREIQDDLIKAGWGEKKEKSTSNIRNPSDPTSKDPIKILSYIKTYYQELFKKDTINLNIACKITNNLPSITEEQNNSLDKSPPESNDIEPPIVQDMLDARLGFIWLKLLSGNSLWAKMEREFIKEELKKHEVSIEIALQNPIDLSIWPLEWRPYVAAWKRLNGKISLSTNFCPCNKNSIEIANLKGDEYSVMGAIEYLRKHSNIHDLSTRDA
ncbi:10533_t:CDS:10 [Cetraspora pellucida]|uniref:10533_t:CDS:1 n=1 Tax=Cetraspora pellucida TaxID=1433469 RepID=A0A9N9BM27_9GLOM|nr:10533_t:CDS:10 [Cetraspora pellucida]